MQVSAASSAQTQEVAKQLRERLFARADKDGSGGLGLDEFSAIRPGRSGPQAAASAGGTAATDRAAKLVARLDTDGDGSLTAAELEARRPAAFSAGSMSALLLGQEGASGMASNGASALFSKLDTNGDGGLATAEFQAASPAGKPGDTRRPHGGLTPGGPLPGGAEKHSGLLASTAGNTGTGGGAADSLAALVRKAWEKYLQAGTAQAGAGTLARA